MISENFQKQLFLRCFQDFHWILYFHGFFKLSTAIQPYAIMRLNPN